MRTKNALSLTVEEIAKAKHLAALGYSIRHIGRELKRSGHTIKRLLTMPTVAAEVSVKKIALEALYEQRAYEIVESVSTEDISKASLQQKAVSSGIFLDKARLIQGQSTSNLSVEILMQLAERIRRDDDEDMRMPQQPEQHTLHAAPEPQQPAIPSQPRTQPAKTQEPTLAPRVRYTSVPAGPHPDHCPDESPLTRGLHTTNS